MVSKNLEPHVIARTIREIRAMAPRADEKARWQILAEIAESYPRFLTGESNALVGKEAVFDARRAVRHSRTLTKIIFGIDPNPALFPSFWDSSTPQLKIALDEYITASDSVIEVGVGHIAINCLYLLKKYPSLKIVGVEKNPRAVSNATAVARHNGLDFVPIVSDMWENVAGTYGRVLFNAPYKPTATLGDVEHSSSPPWVSDGGPTGVEVIRHFASGLRRRVQRKGIVLLAINSYFVNQNQVKDEIGRRGFELKDIVRQLPFPNQVLVFVVV